VPPSPSLVPPTSVPLPEPSLGLSNAGFRRLQVHRHSADDRPAMTPIRIYDRGHIKSTGYARSHALLRRLCRVVLIVVLDLDDLVVGRRLGCGLLVHTPLEGREMTSLHVLLEPTKGLACLFVLKLVEGAL